MAIETTCQTCGKRLRVADEHAGKLAKCPACQSIYTVPLTPALSLETPAAVVVSPAASALSLSNPGHPDRWHLRTPDGLTFGPVTKEVLDQWQREGRIVSQSYLSSDAHPEWVWAGAVYPQLAHLPTVNPFTDSPAPLNPYAPPSSGTYSYRALEPHRGPLILILSIIGLFVCQILEIAAIVMAIIDLNKMSRGTMDPAGRGLTIAGLVISLLYFVLGGAIIAAMVLNG